MTLSLPRLMPVWLRAVSSSAMASTGIILEIISTLNTINNNNNQHLGKIKENEKAKLSEQIKQKFRR